MALIHHSRQQSVLVLTVLLLSSTKCQVLGRHCSNRILPHQQKKSTRPCLPSLVCLLMGAWGSVVPQTCLHWHLHTGGLTGPEGLAMTARHCRRQRVHFCQQKPRHAAKRRPAGASSPPTVQYFWGHTSQAAAACMPRTRRMQYRLPYIFETTQTAAFQFNPKREPKDLSAYPAVFIRP